MSLHETSLTVVFSSSEACAQMRETFDLLDWGEVAQFNKKMAALGAKSRFTMAEPHLEYIEAVDNVLLLQFAHGSDFKFPQALAKKLPDAVLVVASYVDDYNPFGKKSYVYQGQSITKDQLIERMDGLDPRLAFVLATSLGIRLAAQYFKALPDPNEEYLGTLLFWHLVYFLDDNKQAQNLVAKCDLSRRNSRGDTVLHHAARSYGRCFEEAVVWLIKQGCEVDAQNAAGDTPALTASRLPSSRCGAFYVFLKHGADPDAVDAQGYRAVHHFCQQGCRPGWTGSPMEKLIFYKADLNADSPLGSPLWLINKTNRDGARDTLWKRDCRLIPPKDAYSGDAYANLLTAVHHHDVPAMDAYLSEQQLSEAQAHELYCHAFYYQCGFLFDRLRAAHPLRLTANARDTVSGDEYLMNLLKLLYEDHPGTGDSYAMFMTVINDSSSESIRELAESRVFAVNCTRVIEFRTHQAVEFFGLLHRKGLALGELFRVHSDVPLRWSFEDSIPPNLAIVLQELRSLGLILHGSQQGLIDARLDRALVEQLCN